MAFTYAGTPAASNREWIRHRTGDVVSGASASLTDEEIADELTNAGGNKYIGARNCAKARRARMVMVAAGGPETAFRSTLFEQLDALIADLDAEIAASAFGGGIEQSELDADLIDDTLVDQPFAIGKNDNR